MRSLSRENNQVVARLDKRAHRAPHSLLDRDRFYARFRETRLRLSNGNPGNGIEESLSVWEVPVDSRTRHAGRTSNISHTRVRVVVNHDSRRCVQDRGRDAFLERRP